MHCYYELDIKNIDVIKKEWWPTGDISQYYIKLITSDKIDNFVDEILDSNFVKIVNEFYEFKNAAIFNKNIGYCPEYAHVDAEFTTHRFYALNLNPLQVEDNGKMVWYDIDTDIDPILWTHKKSDAPAVIYPFHNLKFKQEFHINKKICLVRTDIPHAIFPSKNIRHCISFRFNKKEDESWDNVISNFKKIEVKYHEFLLKQQQLCHQIPNKI